MPQPDNPQPDNESSGGGSGATRGLRQLFGGRGGESPAPSAGTPTPDSTEAGYETRDIPFRAFAIFGVLLVVTVGVLVFAVSVLLASTTGTSIQIAPPTGGVANAPQSPVPTPVQNLVESGSESTQLKQQAEQTLSSYGWVDKQKGVARIPINVAMDLLAAKGLPARPGATPLPNLDNGGSDAPSSSSSGR